MASRLLLFVLAASLQAQQIITTFAGTEWVFPNNGGAALDTPIAPVVSTALDTQGRLVYADALNQVVLRIEPSGTVTVVAGNGVRGFSGDGGDALRASFDQPRGVAIDKSGNIYIADGRNHRIRRVTPAGIVTTVAGNGEFGVSGDGGPGTAAAVDPWKITLDAAGNLYIADYNNSRLRRLGTDGILTTIGGNGKTIYSGDGQPARDSAFVPFDVHVDSANRILVTDLINYRVYRIGADGIINTIAGTGIRGYSGDGGPAASAMVTNVAGVTTDTAGNILLADTSNRRVRRINAAGIISTIAGGSNAPVTTTPGDVTRANLGLITTITFDQQGRLYLADSDDPRFLLISADGRFVSKIAGNGKFKELLPRTPASLVTMTEPLGLAIAPNGTVYYSENGGHRVAKVEADGAVTRVTGNGVNSCCIDGPADLGRVSFPAGLALAPDGSLIIADANSQKIRRVANGVISSIAGSTFVSGFSGDGGPAVDALINYPSGIVVDPAGNIIFSDRDNHRIRRIDTRGVITTIAGDGKEAYSGDGGRATEASLNFPTALAFNPAGELLIADYGNQRIRAISSTGIIRTFAGTGVIASNGDGRPAIEAAIRYPYGLASDPRGNIYITQDGSGVIRRIDPNGVISTFAGVFFWGFAGDGGSPLAASFSRPLGIAAAANGDVYIADTQNNRIRVVRNLALTTTLSPSPINLTAVAGSATSTPARVTLGSAINGLPFTVAVTYGQSARDWLNVTTSSDTAPATFTLTANASALGAGRYTATLAVTTDPAGASNPVSVSLDVTETAPRLRLSSESISISRPEGSPAETVALEVLNQGGGLLSYAVTAINTGTGKWLTAGPAEGTLRAGQVGAVNVTADPAGLKPGTYLGSLTVSVGAVRTIVPVTFTVRGGRRTILVSQAGLTFTAVSGGGSPTPQKIGILNIGTGSLNWRAAAKGRFTRLSADSGTVNEPWLEVSDLTVIVSPAGLAAGQYYDQIEVTGDADNSPQLVTVLLNVLPEGANPGPEVTPSGMIFIAKQGENPGSQTVTVNHLGKGPVTFDSSRLGTWYESAPGAGRAVPDGPGAVVIQPALAELTPGVRRGVVTFQLQEDGSVRTVNLLSVVAPPDAGNKGERNAASCAAPSLRVESTAIRDGFTVRVGEAVTVEVKAADECGNLLTPLAGGTGAQVIARPENGDPQVALAHIGNGVWRGTWRPVRAAVNTRLTVVAIFLGTTADVIAGRSQAGKVELSGSVLAQGATAAPLLTAGGIAHAASFESGVPIAPGSLITLYGAKLADATGLAAGLPLPASLNGTEVSLGNRPLPLLFTSDGQLNAQIPYDVPVDTQHQILVKRGETIAVPEMLNVAAAQPGVFTKAQNGSGQGVIVKQDGVTLAEPGTPANRGEVVIVYCSGLGPVLPAVVAGRPSPSSPLSSVVNPVTVTIGGQEAQVQFAGLAPGFSGLYQINVLVPAASETGDAVEVILESAGQRSRPVTIAVR
jgi:uncharacterized protein (TIGR03437 family)